MHNRIRCTVWYKLWPVITFGAFYVIRIYELQKLDDILEDRTVQIMLFAIFMPLFSPLTILGFI